VTLTDKVSLSFHIRVFKLSDVDVCSGKISSTTYGDFSSKRPEIPGPCINI
jgi:hypothetical protein